MKLLVCFLLLLSGWRVCPQGIDSVWYRDAQERNATLSLPALASSPHVFHFRLHDDSRILDYWTDTTGTAHAQLTRWVRELVPKEEEPTDRLYMLRTSLEDTTAEQLLFWYRALGIANVPTQDSIDGWVSGLDGNEYELELYSNGRYTFRSWWTPDAFPALPPAVLVKRFADTAFALAGTLNDSVFVAEIPFYSWAVDPGRRVTLDVTPTQYQAYYQERQAYRRRMAFQGSSTSAARASLIPESAFWVGVCDRGAWYDVKYIGDHRNDVYINVYDDQDGHLIVSKKFLLICRFDHRPVGNPLFKWPLRKLILSFDGEHIWLKTPANRSECWLQ